MTAGTAVPSTRSQVAAAWALLAAVAMLMLGNGLQGSLIGVRATIEQFPTIVTGVVMAGYYVGFLAGSWSAPRIVANVGHIRVFAGLASLASSGALIHAIFIGPVPWVLIRVLSGFCIAGLYVVAESWLNGCTTNQTRARLLSVYMIVVTGGIGAGQLLLGAGDPGGFQLFVLASVLVSFSLVPLSLAHVDAPSFHIPLRVPLRKLYSQAPLGMVGAFGVGMGNGALLGMGAVYASDLGMRPATIGLFMGLALVGAMTLQMPLGTLSDRWGRRRSIFTTTMAAAAVAALATLTTSVGVLLGVMLLFGGLAFPLYALCISHVNDTLDAAEIVGASSALVFVTGLGAVAGPILAAVAMNSAGPDGFWWVLAGVHGGVGIFALYRLAVQRRIPVELQRSFANVPARASGLVSLLITKSQDRHE